MATTGLAVLAVAAATYGLIATPEVSTQIGEVPSIGRPLMQLAMVPRVPIEARGDPAEERAAAPELTGMSSDQSIVHVPTDTAGRNGSERMPAPAATADAGSEPSDPLGDLIKATMAQTPERSLTIIAEPTFHQPPPGDGLQESMPDPGTAVTPAAELAEPSSTTVKLEAAPASLTKSGDTVVQNLTPEAEDTAKTETKDAGATEPEGAAQADGEDAVPTKPEETAKTETKGTSARAPEGVARAEAKDPSPAEAGGTANVETKDVAPPKDIVRTSPPAETPTLALDDEDIGRGKTRAKPKGKTQASSLAALQENDPQGDDPAAVRKGRKVIEKPAIEKRKARRAVERRALRRKAVRKSRATASSSRKKRKAVHRVRRHSRRAAAPAPRRGVVVVAPRSRTAPAHSRRSAVRPSPAVRYLQPTYRYQVLPSGYRYYYPAPAGKTSVR
ncbi:MAG: hypothetical protein R3D62_13640 [Xanthobacteraceae bacterium]